MNHKTLIKEIMSNFKWKFPAEWYIPGKTDMDSDQPLRPENLEKAITDALSKQEKEIRKAGYQKGWEDGVKHGKFMERNQVIEEAFMVSIGLLNEIMENENYNSATKSLYLEKLRKALEQLKDKP